MAESRLTIRGLRVRTVEVPMSDPHRTASGTITSSPLVLTDLITDEGPVGSSYVFCYSAVALKPTALLLQGLEPVLVGQPVAPLELERQLAGRFRLLGAQGLTGIALSAIDMAAWTRSPAPTSCRWPGCSAPSPGPCGCTDPSVTTAPTARPGRPRPGPIAA